MPSYNTFRSSTFFDAYGAGQFTQEQYDQLVSKDRAPLAEVFDKPGMTVDLQVATSGSILVGLVLDRAHDASTLLAGNWAKRQADLAAFATPAALWSTYGADTTLYNNTKAQVEAVVGTQALHDAETAGYVSSAADRTIWAILNPDEFHKLFGRDLLDVTLTKVEHGKTVFTKHEGLAWTGNLGLNSTITAGSITALAIPRSVTFANPAVTATGSMDLAPGPLGIANSSLDPLTSRPAAIAENYNFPLPAGVGTGTIGLVEPNENDKPLLDAYNTYRAQFGLPLLTASQFVFPVTPTGNNNTSGELTLDLSVIAGVAPYSSVVMYGGEAFQGYQRAFFDTVNHPTVLSSSFSDLGLATTGSPFFRAFQMMLADGALANVSVIRSGGDSGSSSGVGNGNSNLTLDHTSPYMLIVGGTSITQLSSALSDPTVQTMLVSALHGDIATVFPLVAAGLKTLPSHLSSISPGPLGQTSTLTTLFETVWQNLKVVAKETYLEVSYGEHATGGGGIASGVGIPSYQGAYGLTSMTGGGRGVPDVSALSSGNTDYAVLNSRYVDGSSADVVAHDGGTSAAAPLWAGLTAQFNAIFQDQGLSRLGYYHDLLYTAAVIAPGAFNDVQLGNNITAYYPIQDENDSRYFNPAVGMFMVPTGHGYLALPGYDLVSGLGTPNGTLLARALSAVAHAEVSFSTSPPLLEDDGHGGWQAGAHEALLFQAGGHGATFVVEHGTSVSVVASSPVSKFAWTSRLAQQSLQSDFDPALVKLFDKQAQGASIFAGVTDNSHVFVTADGVGGLATQAGLSNPFGFADFFSGNDTMRVARSVALAQTAGGHDDQVATIRLRQGGEDALQLTLYRVDDLSGTIAGIAPGQAAYAAAVASRAYATTTGTVINGPGYGQFGQVQITNVDAGDHIAMRLDNLTSGTTYWAFGNVNEIVDGRPVNHLWNYGLNTWGWEDTYGGGDHDYNDLVVQIDFTSASGHGWIV